MSQSQQNQRSTVDVFTRATAKSRFRFQSIGSQRGPLPPTPN